MKKSIRTVLWPAALLLCGCGNSITSDAQKVADLQCKVKQLQQNALSGNASGQEEIEEFMAESSALVQEMNAKYTTGEEKREFQEALMKAKANCK